jgi:hypothetical protein
MDCAPTRAQRKQEPAPPCPLCHCPGCGDGSRLLKRQAKVAPDGTLEWVEGIWRPRFRCCNPDCPMRSWTGYEEQGYPHRTFPPAVAAAAVAEFVVGGELSLAAVAEHWGCSMRTLTRWVGWLCGLMTTAELMRVCWAQDPSGMPPPLARADQDQAPPEAGVALWRSQLALAKSLAALFEWLARLCRKRGVPLEKGPGLGALLRHQFDRFRRVCWMIRSSPPLHFDGLSPTGSLEP